MAIADNQQNEINVIHIVELGTKKNVPDVMIFKKNM